jgi:hypothetical protein
MVKKLFTDKKGIQMECYLNSDCNCIIQIGAFDDIMNHHWIELNDIDDIDELIKELKSIRKIMHDSKL